MATFNIAELVEHTNPVQNLDHDGLFAIHENFHIKNTETFAPHRNRKRGTFKTPMLDDFKAYVADKKAPIFVNPQDMTAIAIFNYGDDEQQGHCDDTAQLKLEPTIIYKKLQAIKDKKFNQREFATFLEDYASVFTAIDGSGEHIDFSIAITAVRNMKVDNERKTESTVNHLTETRSAFDKIEANATMGKLPAYLKVTDTAYVGLQEREISLRLVLNTQDDKAYFALQIVKEELLQNELVDEFKQTILNLFDTDVFIGTFTA